VSDPEFDAEVGAVLDVLLEWHGCFAGDVDLERLARELVVKVRSARRDGLTEVSALVGDLAGIVSRSGWRGGR